MSISIIDQNYLMEKIEWARLPGKRFRSAGANSVLHKLGDNVPLDVVQITIAGQSGFGWSEISKEMANVLIGKSTTELFTAEGRVRPDYKTIEFPLMDWLGKATSQPVYNLYESAKSIAPLTVNCYDTSLYMDEIHLTDDKAAIQLMQDEVAQGKERGHRNFKIKVGRGGRHMPLDAGTKRDITVIKAVREAAGPEAKIMIDANNAYNLNIAKQVLSSVAEQKLYWLEEAFFEHHLLYEDLKQWMRQQNINVLIADGEGHSAQPLVEWAVHGYIDVVQYDILTYGFNHWLDLGKVLDKAEVKSSPHNYNSAYGNYVSAHLGALIEGFQFVEWDDIDVAGLDASAYKIVEGKVVMPSLPGFGLSLDGNYFSDKVKENGWTVR